jgi:hypothetical protein
VESQGLLHLQPLLARTSEPCLWSFRFREVESLLVRSRSLLTLPPRWPCACLPVTYLTRVRWLAVRQQQLGLPGLAMSSLLNNVNIAAGVECSGSVGPHTQTISLGQSDQSLVLVPPPSLSIIAQSKADHQNVRLLNGV